MHVNPHPNPAPRGPGSRKWVAAATAADTDRFVSALTSPSSTPPASPKAAPKAPPEWPSRPHRLAWERFDALVWLLVVSTPVAAVVVPTALLLVGVTAWPSALGAACMLGICLLGCLMLKGSEALRARHNRQTSLAQRNQREAAAAPASP
jgi:hypothetical protein